MRSKYERLVGYLQLKKVCPELLKLTKNKFGIRLDYVGFGATVANYIVDLGRFQMPISLLNMPGTAPKQKQHNSEADLISRNTNMRLECTEFVKIVPRTAKTLEELEKVIRQVAITKLCSQHQIAPKLQRSIPFDLIVYEDCFHYHLERLTRLDELQKLNRFDIKLLQRLESDLFGCLDELHRLHIVHKNIRPSNILFDEHSQRFMFCGYGDA